MNKSLIFCGGILALKLANPAGAAVVLSSDWTVNAAIPEGSPVGITTSQTFAGLGSGGITGVTVDLNITGGYNGGLYGYLVLQDASGNVASEILLNQLGTAPGNPFGSSGAGMNVTLSDAGTVNGTIHGASGVPSGLWQPDSASDLNGTFKSLNGTFGGLSANGTWTLFLADLTAGGGTSTLNSWGLTINAVAVPEPGFYAMLAGALLLGLPVRRALKYRS